MPQELHPLAGHRPRQPPAPSDAPVRWAPTTTSRATPLTPHKSQGALEAGTGKAGTAEITASDGVATKSIVPRSISSGDGTAATASRTLGKSTLSSEVPAATANHPEGGTICTMLSHFGQAWISPITSSLRTFSRAPHVSQMTRKGSNLASETKKQGGNFG
jgi:hypothetical protein